MIPATIALRDAIDGKARAWADVVKIGRTHMQAAVPLTLGQEWSGYVATLDDHAARIERALGDVHEVALGGTAVGTGLNAPAGFAARAVAELARLTDLPLTPARNRFAAQGEHAALVALSGALRGLAASLFKIASDVRFLASSDVGELRIPANEPGSSIMPGKVNPTQCESLTMISAQVMASDVAVGFGDASGHLEMNVYKPLIVVNVLRSICILADGARNFRAFVIEGTEPDLERARAEVERAPTLVTALTPLIGYDAAARVARYATERGVTIKRAAAELRLVDPIDFDRVVDPMKMTR